MATNAFANDPNVELFWALAQRLLAFDDPGRTLAQMRKACGKWRSSSTASRADQWLPFWSTEKFHRSADRRFTALFTVETALRIRETYWTALSLQSQQWADEHIVQDDFERDFVRYAFSSGACAPALKWCITVLRMNLPWHFLATSGPWADDVRATMVANVLDAVNRVSCETDYHSLVSSAPLFQNYLDEHRRELPANLLPKGIFLVEGATEAILFPRAASCLERSLESRALLLVAAGGANQVVKRFMHLKEMVMMPIACALDADAVEQAQLIRESLRERDQLYVLDQGEVEDTFGARLFTDLLNQYLQGSLASSEPIKMEEFARLSRGQRKTRVAHQLLRQRASLDFDKVQFAKLAAQRFKTESDIPDELRYIVRTIVDGLSGVADGK